MTGDVQERRPLFGDLPSEPLGTALEMGRVGQDGQLPASKREKNAGLCAAQLGVRPHFQAGVTTVGW